MSHKNSVKLMCIYTHTCFNPGFEKSVHGFGLKMSIAIKLIWNG